MRVNVEWVRHGTSRCAQLVELRRDVLRKPIGLDYSPEQLAEEADQLHLGAWEGKELLGCLLLKIGNGDEIVMRQVAVAPQAQGKGIGRLLVEEAEDEAVRRGMRRMVLHAREDAVAFYERLGYHVEGAPFTEVGLPHRNMAKDLQMRDK